jgi:chromosome segregation ATPase
MENKGMENVEDLTKKLDGLMDEYHSYVKSNKLNINTKVIEEINNIKNAINNYTNFIDSSKRNIDSINVDFNENHEVISDLTINLENSESKIRELNTTINFYHEENYTLARKIEDMNKTVSDLNKELLNLKDKVVSTQEDALSSQQNNNYLNGIIDELNHNIDLLKLEIAKHLYQIELNENLLLEKYDENLDLHNKIKSAYNHAESLQEELTNEKEKVEEYLR